MAKLENTVETLRTVLTQKIQSEAQTVSVCVLLNKGGVLFAGINTQYSLIRGVIVIVSRNTCV